MTTPIAITDGGTGQHANIYDPSIDKLTGKPGLVTYTKPLLPMQRSPGPLLNNNFGISLNQNASFGGTPEGVTDGTDTTQWTLSQISGTSVSVVDDDRAAGAVVTIVDYTGLAGDTITLGVDGVDTVKTEGATWTAATSNTATATSLASDLDSISGVTATSNAAVVTIKADDGFNISKLDASDATNSPATARSILIDNPIAGNVWQFAKGSDIALSSYVALTMQINIDKNWNGGDSVSIYGFDVGVGQVGIRVLIENYVDITVFDTWQSITIPLTDMGLQAATIDAFRFEQDARAGAAATWYLDDFQIEETGSDIVFKFTPRDSQLFHVEQIGVFVANQSMTEAQIQAYDKFYGLTALENGVGVLIQSRGNIVISAAENTLEDQLTQPQISITTGGDGTNSWIKVNNMINFDLDGGERDFIEYRIQDDLTALDSYNVWIFGWAERLE